MHDVSKKVRSLCPSGVTIIATVDGEGQPRGFTAGSLVWLSSAPPLVTFCIAHRANSFPAFAQADGFAVSLLRPEHADLAVRFATKGIDKFAGGDFCTDDGGYPTLDTAVAALQCRVRERTTAADHLFVVGEVVDARVTEGGSPLVMYRNTFQTLAAAS